MTLLYAFFVVLASAFIQSSTGFGFGIVAIPLLMVVLDPHTAIFLSGALSLVSCLYALFWVRRDVNVPMLKRLFIGSLFGLPVGAALYFLMDVTWLKLLVSLCILAAAGLMLRRLVFPMGRGLRVGVVSGALTTSVGMPGPPVVMLLTMARLAKAPFRGTSIAYYCLVYPVSLLFQWLSDRVVVHSLEHAYWYVPAIFLGQWLGGTLHKLLSPIWFRRVTFVLLLATAVNAFVPSVLSLYALTSR